MKTNIRKIEGNWDAGYALDKHTVHSESTGHNEYGHPIWNTTRTEAGEALFQLKYRGNFDLVEVIATELAESIYPSFECVELIVPMPASNLRNRQPVIEIAEALGCIVQKPVFDELLTKTTNGQQLKDMTSKAEKQEALANSFALQKGIANEGCWNALLVDDLYHTGASLEAACAVLHGYNKINKIYVATVTWR